MKKLTVQEVMEALQDYHSLEWEHWDFGEGYCYYLHITDEGKIVGGYDDADMSLTSGLAREAWEDYEPGYDFRDEIEVPENEYFMEVVEDLTDQANEYLEEWGE